MAKNLTNNIFSIRKRRHFYRVANKNFKQKLENVDLLTPDFQGDRQHKMFPSFLKGLFGRSRV